MSPARILPDYAERVYAGWLGKCIGVRFGAPIEGWTYQEIRDNLGPVLDYLPLPPGKVFKPDDDTSMPMILIRALEEYGPEVTAAEIGETWLNYLGDQRGTLWWGGYGLSTEHTAYLNLAAGIPAPQSGSIALNGAALVEQVGGQIFSDIWGLVSPNNPEQAAAYAARAASVSHDGNGVYGGMFIAALVSQSFSEADPSRLIEAGLALIPSESEYTRLVRAVLDFHYDQPDDWHTAYRFIAEHFGYDRYPGLVHIIPNAGVVAMALLYGEGDFSRSIQIANMAGWDTDCNVGNVGAIMGVAVGLEGIPMRWREPMNDVLVAASVIGTRNLLDIPACADLFSALGRQIAGEPAVSAKPRYHFSYAGATQGWLHRGQRGRIMALRQVSHGDGGALQATVRKLNKKGEVRLFVKTYYRPEELSANYYGASFSPKLYPGQTIRARVLLPAEAPTSLRAALYVRDGNRGEEYQDVGQPLSPGQWHDFVYRIPELRGVCLSEVGIVVRNLDGDPWTGLLLVDSLDWDGSPRFSYDFLQERHEYGAISQWTFLRGYWRLDDGAYHGSGHSISESYSGDIDWRDYTLTVRLTPLLGEHHNLNLRVQGARRSYAVGLAPDQHLTLYKNAQGYRPMATVPFAWEHGRSYEISVTAQGNCLTVQVGGETLLTWADEGSPYLHGQIGLSNFAGCHTRYEDVHIH